MSYQTLEAKIQQLIEKAQSSGGGDSKYFQLIERSIENVSAEDLRSISSIGNYAFADCKNITSLTIPPGVSSTYGAFQNCTSLVSVTIEDGVTNIGAAMFLGCSSLTSITIPASVASMGGTSLRIGSSANKATITMLGTTPPTIYANNFEANKLNKIIVPVGCGDAYKSATNWSAFADYIEEATE